MADLKLVSGECYSLSQLFHGENDKIVIPDLQRDYCWAANNLVVPFIETLLSMDKSQNLTMGLIYGYFDELMPEHLQLCDGQQRITTLFLLLGVLNRKLNNRYRSILISDFELLHDDREPYLQYAIRESSLYFLSDITIHYFLGLDESDNKLRSTQDIEKCYWFLSSYKQDPTIINVIKAIADIEHRLTGLSNEELISLGDFVSGLNTDNKILFLYYDMQNRANGEETFVVINTTGEPLTANQNMKPLVINRYKSEVDDVELKWENMETWFWQHRDKNDTTHTSDEGMSEFFRVARLFVATNNEDYLNIVDASEPFPFEEIHFSKLYKFFKIYSRVYSIPYTHNYPINYNNKNNRGRFAADQLYALLPTLKYVERFSNATNLDIERVYHLFRTMSLYSDVNNRRDTLDVPVRKIMNVIDEMSNTDVLCLKDSNSLNAHERSKLHLIADNIDIREQVEAYLAVAERYPIFNGRLNLVLNWCNNSFSMFQKYFGKIRTLWGDAGHGIDSLRRALLTWTWTEYPIVIEKKNHMTLGWEWTAWYNFFEKNNEQCKTFLDCELPIEKQIEDYVNINDPYYPIIKDSSYLAASHSKNITARANNILILMEKERTQANYCIFLNNIAYPKNFLGGGWHTPWEWKGLLYCDHVIYNLTIDYFYDQDKGYWMYLWEGKLKNHKTFKHLHEVEQFDFYKIDKGSEGWCSRTIQDGTQAQQLAIKIAHWVDSFDK